MKPTRWALAALCGGLVMFVWGAVSHLVLFEGMGFTRLEHEDRVVAELERSIQKEGLYFLPSPDFSKKSGSSEQAAFEARFRKGPTAMIVFHRSGGEPVSPRKLGTQFLSELLAAGIGALLVSFMCAPYWKRASSLALMGAFGCLSISALYWNWYGFPTAFFLAQCADKVIGWSLAGLIIARIVPVAPTPG